MRWSLWDSLLHVNAAMPDNERDIELDEKLPAKPSISPIERKTDTGGG